VNRLAAQLLLGAVDVLRPAALRSYRLFTAAAAAPGRSLESLSPHAAMRSALRARDWVPAYSEYLDSHGWRDEPRLPIGDRVRRLPITDKDSYVRAYPTAERCVGGTIPLQHTQIDESSGSSGVPYNWVRGKDELEDMHREMAHFSRWIFGQPLITINSFSMGAWATGVNVGEALRQVGMVKSTGPDIDKILGTLEFFGSGYRYLLTGYPPFLKHLVEAGLEHGFDWSAYQVAAIVGGEAISEEMRAFIEHHIRPVYSGYGASDVAMGIAAETPLTVWLRKRAHSDCGLRENLLGDQQHLPMLFQYNPLDHYVETNDEGELIFTVSRPLLSPRIRYNLHDLGGTIPFDSVCALLRESGLEAEAGHRLHQWRWPLLYVAGRSDSTVSYMGANLYPADVERAIFAEPSDHGRYGAFCLELATVGAGGEARPTVHVEDLLPERDAVNRRSGEDALARRVISHLAEVNRDFRSALAEDPSAAQLSVVLHDPGEGPFVQNSRRIKRAYVLRTDSPMKVEA